MEQMFGNIPAPVVNWIMSSSEANGFAKSLREQMEKKGALSPKQIAAVERTLERVPPKPVKAVNTQKVHIDRLMEVFNSALESGLKRPRLRFNGFEARLPSATSANAGGVYILVDGSYVGKIIRGQLLPKQGVTIKPATREAIDAAMENPFEAAVTYGRITGNCSCCGKLLTKKESIQLGIGPICRAKFGM